MEALLQAPLLGHNSRLAGDAAGSAERAELQRRVALGVYLSLAANIALLAAKSLAYTLTGSMAVAASMVDSMIDLASQGLIALADRAMSR
jgi:divalent metal cation (Fe/Co/Zn/Cd) transporter